MRGRREWLARRETQVPPVLPAQPGRRGWPVRWGRKATLGLLDLPVPRAMLDLLELLVPRAMLGLLDLPVQKAIKGLPVRLGQRATLDPKDFQRRWPRRTETKPLIGRHQGAGVGLSHGCP
jgi:hypothetical protein